MINVVDKAAFTVLNWSLVFLGLLISIYFTLFAWYFAANDSETGVILIFRFLYAEWECLPFDILVSFAITLFMLLDGNVIEFKCAVNCLLVFKARWFLDVIAATLVLVVNVLCDIGCLLLMA